jgi:hypothetical protein
MFYSLPLTPVSSIASSQIRAEHRPEHEHPFFPSRRQLGCRENGLGC